MINKLYDYNRCVLELRDTVQESVCDIRILQRDMLMIIHGKALEAKEKKKNLVMMRVIFRHGKHPLGTI